MCYNCHQYLWYCRVVHDATQCVYIPRTMSTPIHAFSTSRDTIWLPLYECRSSHALTYHTAACWKCYKQVFLSILHSLLLALGCYLWYRSWTEQAGQLGGGCCNKKGAMHNLAMVSEGFLYTDQDSSKLQKKDGEVKTNG